VAACGDDSASSPSGAGGGAAADAKIDGMHPSEAGAGGSPSVDAQAVDAPANADAGDAVSLDVSVEVGDAGTEASSDAGSGESAADADGRATEVDGRAVDASADTAAPVDATPPDVSSPPDANNTSDGTTPSLDAAPTDGAIDVATGDGGPVTYPGDKCEDAVVIGPGHYTGQVAVGYTSNYGVSGCSAKAGLPDRVYSVPVGIGQVLDAKLTRDGFYDSTLDVVLPPVSNCGMECLASSDYRLGTPEEIQVVNRFGATSMYLIVGTYADPGSYSLDVSVDDTPPGSVCETAVAITPGILYGQSLVGFYDTYNFPTSNCTGYYDFGPDRVYSISVPAGDTLTVSAKPVAGLDISIYLIRGPAQNCRSTDQECLVGADDALEGGLETVTYRNQSASAETMFIVIDMYNRLGDPGAFTLTTTITH
jgi:hypothetical protein